MTLTAGARIGPFEITGTLGAGGMGEVYRARDTRLKRDVALKILPESFAADPERLARFQREAEVLASLNHPNIAAIHGFEESNPSAGSGPAAIHALILELAEGPTLADRVRQGPIPVDEALPIAKQIAARERIILYSALAFVAVIAAVSTIWAFREAPLPREMRLEITTPPTTDPTSLAISPDGQKLAFVASSEGGPQLWLRSLDSVPARPLARTEGATYPFYLAPDGRLMVVTLRPASDGQAIEVGAPGPLFATRIGRVVPGGSTQQYMVSPDGQRFLMNTVTEEATAPITVILNWKPRS